jgi:hypothetical protein
MARQPLGGLGRLILRGFTITLLDTPQSAGLLWTRDQLVAETSTWQYTTLTRDRHPCPPGGIRTHNPSKRAGVDPRLRPRGHRPLGSALLIILLLLLIIDISWAHVDKRSTSPLMEQSLGSHLLKYLCFHILLLRFENHSTLKLCSIEWQSSR